MHLVYHNIAAKPEKLRVISEAELKELYIWVKWAWKAAGKRALVKDGRARWEKHWYGAPWLAFVLGLGLSASASGQLTVSESPHELEPVEVTATAIPTALSLIPSSVTIISREQIEAQQSQSVVEVLRQVPGLHIDQVGGRGGVSSVYIRGADPNFTVVLIDGVKVNDPTNSRGGSFNFSTLSTDNIERIEIIRGPLSALYGSDAMSGVINIITRRGGSKSVMSIEGSGGRFEQYRALVGISGILGIMDYALSGSYLDNGEPVEGDRFISKTFFGNLGLSLTDSIKVRWVMRYANNHSESFPDDSGGPKFAVIRAVDKRDTSDLTVGINLTHDLFPWWQYSLQVRILDHQEDASSPGVAPGMRDPFGIPPNTNDNDFQRYNFTMQHLFSFAKWARLAIGAEAVFEDGSSRGNLIIEGSPVPTSFDLDRNIFAPFFEVQLFPIRGLLLREVAHLNSRIIKDIDHPFNIFVCVRE